MDFWPVDATVQQAEAAETRRELGQLVQGSRDAGARRCQPVDECHVSPCHQAEAAEAQRDGEQLVWEVWDVVDREFLDARATGFDRGQWATARDSALAGTRPSRRGVNLAPHL